MSVQQTLTGEETDAVRERPDTFVWCEACEDVVLRSREWDHRHDCVELDELADGEEDEENEPERIGSLYDITISYNVDYRFRIPAWSEHQAEEIAKDWKLDARPCDEYHVHTERREVKEVMSDDPKVPDDFDPYGSTRLHEVYGEQSDKAEKEEP